MAQSSVLDNNHLWYNNQPYAVLHEIVCAWTINLVIISFDGLTEDDFHNFDMITSSLDIINDEAVDLVGDISGWPVTI